MDGRDVERLVELSLDGELEPSEEADFAARVKGSPLAREEARRVREYHLGLREKLREASRDTLTPPDLRARVVYRLRREVDQVRERTFPWGRAVAATLSVAVVALASWAGTTETLDPEDLVARHSRNRPPEIQSRGSGPTLARFLEPNLGYPVQVPQAVDPNVRLVGARLASIRNHDAAHVMYDHRGARISLFAFPKPRWVRPPEGFRSEVVRGREVILGQHRGYNVVSFAENELMYALVSDLDSEELVSIVAGFRPSN